MRHLTVIPNEQSLAFLLEKRRRLIESLFACLTQQAQNTGKLDVEKADDLAVAWDEYDIAVIERYLDQHEGYYSNAE